MARLCIGQGAGNLVADSIKKSFLLNEAVDEGDAVNLVGATGYTVEQCDGVTDDGIGFAAEAGAAGEWVEVYVEGYCPKAFVSGTTVAGEYLAAGATAGQGANSTTKTTLSIAVALAADTVNFAPVMVFGKF